MIISTDSSDAYPSELDGDAGLEVVDTEFPAVNFSDAEASTVDCSLEFTASSI